MRHVLLLYTQSTEKIQVRNTFSYARVHGFSKNIGATSKLYVTEGWFEAN